MALAGFSVGEAEGLRRAMSRKRSARGARGVPRPLRRGRARQAASTRRPANRVYDKLVGFSGFGFPKSHAAAFGLLAYQSAWLRHHYPAEFLCALLNAQPMGFYPPASLVRDAPAARGGGAAARREPQRGEVRASRTERCASGSSTSAGSREDEAKALVAERERRGPFTSVATSRSARSSSEHGLEALVAAGACDCFGCRGASSLWQLGLVPRTRERPGLGRGGAPARAPARPDDRDAGAAGADRLGADARRLPDDEPLGRRPSARSSCARTCPTASSRAASSPGGAPGERRDRRDGRRAPAAGDRERRRLHAARGRVRAR